MSVRAPWWALGAAVGGMAAVAAVRRRRRARLRGQTVLITGGSRGLGLELARRFGAEGCSVAICARDERELRSAARELRRRGIPVLAYPADVSRPDEVADVVAVAERRFGAVDVLVNNAGVIQAAPLEDTTRADFEEAMDAIFRGTLHATRAVLPGMLARGSGRVVNITSIGGEVPIPHLLPYVSAKFATVGFSEGLRTELAGTGVGVTTVVPGLMRTGSPVHARFGGQREEEYAWFSLAASLPFTSMSAGRAARKIVEAAARGKTYVVLSWQAKALRLAHALAPTATLQVLGMVNRLLPSASDTERPGRGRPVSEEDRPAPARGMELAHPLAPSFLTALSTRAARRNNEYGGTPRPSREHARRAGLEASPPDAGGKNYRPEAGGAEESSRSGGEGP